MKKRFLLLLLTLCILLSCLAPLSGCSAGPALLSVVYDGSYMQKRYAYEWAQMLFDTVDVLEADDVRVTDRRLTKRHCYVELCVDTEIGDGNWKIEVEDDRHLKVYASDGYGFISASRYFAKAWKKNGSYTEAVTCGNYLQTMNLLREESTKYAFNRQGEYRVMFNNVLWWDPAPEERNYLNAEVVARYRPDVLGLQEMNKSKRGYTEDGKGGLIAMLAEYGYVEAVDPRVKNFYATDEIIPGTDAGPTQGEAFAGQPIYGYGTSGGTEVTVNGETFYTNFNCTPLLYNQYTTKLIKAEYYWYKNQWDTREGVKHENSAGDCASKAATWGVFEDKATGERYIAISTHMCTRSRYVASLQAEEMIALIDRLIEEYQCPVILGGDYNGTVEYEHYRKFAASGLTNVRRDGIASVYVSHAGGHHTYPAYDEKAGLTLPAKNDNTGTFYSDRSVDHIMIKNNEKMDVAVFGVVIDDCTMSGSDHFPMYMDFSIQS